MFSIIGRERMRIMTGDTRQNDLNTRYSFLDKVYNIVTQEMLMGSCGYKYIGY